jgi:hypothetical protein
VLDLVISGIDKVQHCKLPDNGLQTCLTCLTKTISKTTTSIPSNSSRQVIQLGDLSTGLARGWSFDWSASTVLRPLHYQ